MTFSLVQIGDYFDVVAGGTPRRSETRYWGGNIPWVKISDMSEGRVLKTDETITKDGLEESPAKLLPKGTLLLSIFATVGRTARLEIEACTNQAIVGLVQRGDSFDSRFLKYAIEDKSQELINKSRGAAQANINSSILRSTAISLPPLPEQKRIASILDTADAVRRKRAESLETLDELAPSLFHELFGDPVTNPMGWESLPLEETCQKVIDCPHSTPKWSESGVICLRTSNLGKGDWIWDDTRYVTDEDYLTRSKRGEAFPGDIILSREGTVGVAAIVNEGMRVCMGQRLVQLRTNDLVNPTYLLHVLLHDLAPERIGRMMAGSTSKHLNVKDLRKLIVNTPPLDLQKQFASVIETIEAQKTRLRAHLAEAEALFASLQHRAFAGEL